jgi:hypothetical protein
LRLISKGWASIDASPRQIWTEFARRVKSYREN